MKRTRIRHLWYGRSTNTGRTDRLQNRSRGRPLPRVHPWGGRVTGDTSHLVWGGPFQVSTFSVSVCVFITPLFLNFARGKNVSCAPYVDLCHVLLSKSDSGVPVFKSVRLVPSDLSSIQPPFTLFFPFRPLDQRRRVSRRTTSRLSIQFENKKTGT